VLLIQCIHNIVILKKQQKPQGIEKQMMRNYLVIFSVFCFQNGVAEETSLNADVKRNALIEEQKKWLDDRTFEYHKERIESYFIKPGDLVLDVGANEGCYSFRYSNLVGPEGQVIAYEPNPNVFDYLKRALRDRHARGEIFANVLAKQKAVSDIEGIKRIMEINPLDQICLGGTLEPAFMGEWRIKGGQQIVVETETLDQLCLNELLPLHFIKIDVEGHEHAVFDGAKKLLTIYRPIILFEYANVPGVFESNTIEQMALLGYCCYELHNDQRVYNGYLSGGTDLLGIPLEKEEEVRSILPSLY
jgi:FkbM family methyltransferase